MLEPLSQETAQAVVDGAPDGLRRGEGWPHADTLDAFGMVAKHGSEAWLILENGVVVGDAGTHGPPDENRDVEIGYGLAEPLAAAGSRPSSCRRSHRRYLLGRRWAASSRARCSQTTCRHGARSSARASGSSVSKTA